MLGFLITLWKGQNEKCPRGHLSVYFQNLEGISPQKQPVQIQLTQSHCATLLTGHFHSQLGWSLQMPRKQDQLEDLQLHAACWWPSPTSCSDPRTHGQAFSTASPEATPVKILLSLLFKLPRSYVSKPFDAGECIVILFSPFSLGNSPKSPMGESPH